MSALSFQPASRLKLRAPSCDFRPIGVLLGQSESPFATDRFPADARLIGSAAGFVNALGRLRQRRVQLPQAIFGAGDVAQLLRLTNEFFTFGLELGQLLPETSGARLRPSCLDDSVRTHDDSRRRDGSPPCSGRPLRRLDIGNEVNGANRSLDQLISVFAHDGVSATRIGLNDLLNSFYGVLKGVVEHGVHEFAKDRISAHFAIQPDTNQRPQCLSLLICLRNGGDFYVKVVNSALDSPPLRLSQLRSLASLRELPLRSAPGGFGLLQRLLSDRFSTLCRLLLKRRQPQILRVGLPTSDEICRPRSNIGDLCQRPLMRCGGLRPVPLATVSFAARRVQSSVRLREFSFRHLEIGRTTLWAIGGESRS